MENYLPQLKQFINQAQTENLRTKHYVSVFKEFNVKVSFGQGNLAKIPWISFLMSPNTTSNGIYPVYLLYKSINKLILAYGISETISPNYNWNIEKKQTLKEYFSEHGFESPERYGGSYLFRVYDLESLPEEQVMEDDLNNILAVYKTQDFTIDVTSKSYWYVGASYDNSSEDMTDYFVEHGIWQNGYEDKYLDLVRKMKPGDKIAIKSSYTRKYNLPFDNKENTVSVMGIKAIGVITKNLNDGKKVEVDWETKFEPIREWYFYTNRSTIWRVRPGEWEVDDLIDFTFNDGEQDIDRFRNAPYWRERFGDISDDIKRFKWTPFYESIADKLLEHKEDRAELVKFIFVLAHQHSLSYLLDKEIEDFDPFTIIGIFNRGTSNVTRREIAKELADFLKVEEEVPIVFEGIPALNNQKSCFFGFGENKKETDIDSLWHLFESALKYSDESNPEDLASFLEIYDKVTYQYIIGWNITMALYWIRPWHYVTLDKRSRLYITKKLGLEIPKNGPKNRCSANDYIKINEDLKSRFQEEAYPVHSFPELSLSAFTFKEKETPDSLIEEPDEEDYESDATDYSDVIELYDIENIITDGSFLGRQELERVLERLRTKKNIILQGPPGTGKTWLAKKIAFALIGLKDDSKIKAVQFHPNLSYEDFVRGWRPSGEGKLDLVDGPFLEMISEAKKNPQSKYVVVIEEINRGKPAQIFGEMLTLIEADKRTPNEAIELCYRSFEREKIFVPDNLFIVGTMNIADRSIALVDLALRRRFAFVDLEPVFGEKWRNWVHTKAEIDMQFLEQIEERITSLNIEIEEDRILGPQFKIGHSYVTPPFNVRIKDAEKWFRSVVETEIFPLLEEYWYDDLDKAQKAKERLLEIV